VIWARQDPAGLYQGVCEPVGREGAWYLRTFVSTALEKTVDRAVIRERRVSCPVEVERRWRERYVPSQQFYFATVRPTDHANIIVPNDEPQQPGRETQIHLPQPGTG